jgi:alpha-L-rhamnosidase
MYGKITSEWEVFDKQVVYTIIIPANTTATLFIKASNLDKISENGKKIKQVKSITYIGQKGDKLVFSLLSGDYKFIVKK